MTKLYDFSVTPDRVQNLAGQMHVSTALHMATNALPDLYRSNFDNGYQYFSGQATNERASPACPPVKRWLRGVKLTPNQRILGDPLPGRSALDMKRAQEKESQ